MESSEEAEALERTYELLKDRLPPEDFKRFKQADVRNLVINKRFQDEKDLKRATVALLQSPPGDVLPGLLIDSLLKAFHPEELLPTGGGPPLSTPWDLDDDRCSLLSAFIKALPAEKLALLAPGTVIELAHNAVWLGMQHDATAHLYVRPCYPDLLQARSAYIAVHKWEDSCRTIFTGTPGVGKSHLAAIFVAQCLQDGFEVLLECLDGTCVTVQFYWLAPSGQVEHTMDTSAAHRRLTQSTKAIYVTDGCPPGLPWLGGHIVTFCSPQLPLRKPINKAKRALYFYVPVLALEEVLSMRQALPLYAEKLNEKSVKRWFSWAGGSARACLNVNLRGYPTLTAWRDKVQDLLMTSSTDQLMKMIKCDGLETLVDGSDRLFHWFLPSELPRKNVKSPTEDRFRQYTRRRVRFASDNIRNMALLTLDMSKMADVAMACLGDSMSNAGYWLELLAVRCLQGGVKLDAALLPDPGKDRIPFQLSLPTAATVAHWSSPKEAAKLCRADMSIICLPHRQNEPAIDAMSSPSLFWQITKAKRHGLVRSALTRMKTATEEVDGGRKVQLEALRQRITWHDAAPRLSKPLLCFLVPPDRFDTDFKGKQPYTEDGKASKVQSEVVHQCVVKLPLQTIVDKCSNKGAAERFSRRVEKLYDEEAEASGSAEALDISSDHLSLQELTLQLKQPPFRSIARRSD